MGDPMQRKIEQWAGNQVLTVGHRVMTVLLLPVLLAAGAMLLRHESAIGLLEQRGTDTERRLVVIELQQRDHQAQNSGVRADLAALAAQQQAAIRQLERIERLMERRADAGAEGQAITR